MPDTRDPVTAPCSLLRPLAAFYREAGIPVPPVRFIEAGDIPTPYRLLLAHENDMTSTLEKYHRAEIELKLMRAHQDGDVYEREVLLVTKTSRTAVEFGAIRIALDQFPGDARELILQNSVPLGAILKKFGIAFSSQPQGFFEIDPDDVISAALDMEKPRTLYGRCNRLVTRDEQLLAEIVEILPA